MQQDCFLKKPQILYTTHPTEYCEKAVGKSKSFSKDDIALRTT